MFKKLSANYYQNIFGGVFSTIPCFQEIPLNRFRRMRLCNFILDKKEQKAMLLVGFWSNMYIGFAGWILACLNGSGQVNLTAQKLEYREKFVQPLYENTLQAKTFWNQNFLRFLWFLANFWKIKAAKNKKKHYFLNISQLNVTKSWICLCFLWLFILKNACFNSFWRSNYRGNTDNSRKCIAYDFI